MVLGLWSATVLRGPNFSGFRKPKPGKVPIKPMFQSAWGGVRGGGGGAPYSSIQKYTHSWYDMVIQEIAQASGYGT